MSETARRFNYLGPADMLRLDTACAVVRDAFDGNPFLVGSVLRRMDFRDVDVRMVVSEERYRQMFPDDPHGRLLALLVNSAVSDWLARASGLRVDFQIQSVAEAHVHSGERIPLAMHDTAIRYAPDDREGGDR